MTQAVLQHILSANDQVAAENRATLDRAFVYGLNLMGSPGAGKTSLLLATAQRLSPWLRPGAIEGDLASRIDADTLAAHGIPVTQINTGGGCHLDGPMIRAALPALPLDTIDILFVENVGNLVCPAHFQLGTHLDVLVASVAEGHDKPYKYPGMFGAAGVVVLNKADLLELFEFDLAMFRRGVELVNPGAPVFVVSSRSGDGLSAWMDWLSERSAR